MLSLLRACPTITGIAKGESGRHKHLLIGERPVFRAGVSFMKVGNDLDGDKVEIHTVAWKPYVGCCAQVYILHLTLQSSAACGRPTGTVIRFGLLLGDVNLDVGYESGAYLGMEGLLNLVKVSFLFRRPLLAGLRPVPRYGKGVWCPSCGWGRLRQSGLRSDGKGHSTRHCASGSSTSKNGTQASQDMMVSSLSSYEAESI